MSGASDAYRKAVTDTQAIRQEYFNFQLPRILRVSIFAEIAFLSDDQTYDIGFEGMRG